MIGGAQKSRQIITEGVIPFGQSLLSATPAPLSQY